jgi:glycosyltransferase involved in cell wall biosynthesis
MECMALEKPVVAFDVGGIGEMVTDGLTGALVAGSDIDALARSLTTYANDPSRRERHGKAARDVIVREYDAKSHAREVEEILVRAAVR